MHDAFQDREREDVNSPSFIPTKGGGICHSCQDRVRMVQRPEAHDESRNKFVVCLSSPKQVRAMDQLFEKP